jgi:hypothetical protein
MRNLIIGLSLGLGILPALILIEISERLTNSWGLKQLTIKSKYEPGY